jgi:hypothetical protein
MVDGDGEQLDRPDVRVPRNKAQDEQNRRRSDGNGGATCGATARAWLPLLLWMRRGER